MGNPPPTEDNVACLFLGVSLTGTASSVVAANSSSVKKYKRICTWNGLAMWINHLLPVRRDRITFANKLSGSNHIAH